MAQTGALSSLGLGSQGALSYDVIDKLRAADEKMMIEPIDKKLETVQKKQTELDTIVTLAASFKTAISDLSDSTLFAKRSATVTGDDISVSVQDGADVQSFDITVKQLAKPQIDESKGFASTSTALIAADDSDDTFTITTDGKDYTFDITAGSTTLEDLKDAINDGMSDSVTASILNVGGSDPYKLVLKSAQTGASHTMSYSYGSNDFLSFSSVQGAQNAAFTYNGIDVTRESNEIDDLVNGVTINLLKENSSGVNRVDITQDIEGIADEMSQMADAYNALISELDSATKYDATTKEAGLFQGENTITSLRREISDIVLSTDPSGHGLSDYGIDVTKDGVMTFDKSAFEEQLKSDPAAAETLFTDSDTGIFNRLDEYLASEATRSNSVLHNFDDYLGTSEDSLQEQRVRMVELLDARYGVMAAKFAAYDEMINQFNASFASLQQQILYETSQKS